MKSSWCNCIHTCRQIYTYTKTISDHIYKLLWKLVLSATYNFKTNPIKQLALDFLAEVDKEELLKHLNKQFKSYTSIYFNWKDLRD